MNDTKVYWKAEDVTAIPTTTNELTVPENLQKSYNQEDFIIYDSASWSNYNFWNCEKFR